MSRLLCTAPALYQLLLRACEGPGTNTHYVPQVLTDIEARSSGRLLGQGHKGRDGPAWELMLLAQHWALQRSCCRIKGTAPPPILLRIKNTSDI